MPDLLRAKQSWDERCMVCLDAEQNAISAPGSPADGKAPGRIRVELPRPVVGHPRQGTEQLKSCELED